MKQFLACIIIILTGCNGEPLVAPSSPETFWIDVSTASDTIITNVNNQSPVIYYAAKNWQSSSDTNLTHGFRFVGIRYSDTVLVKPLNDSGTNYQRYICGNNANPDTLQSQNFLDSTGINPVKKYVRLK